MTTISKAALPPIQPPISDTDRTHPLFALYQQHRSSCSNLLIEASSFRDWLYQYERNLESDHAVAHPQYPEFLAWCRDTKAGRRACAAGVFPHNFYFWMEGGRW